MTVVLTAGLILLFIAVLGAIIAGATMIAETLGRRSAVANLIGGVEALLRSTC